MMLKDCIFRTNEYSSCGLYPVNPVNPVSIAKAIPRIYTEYCDYPMIKTNMIEEGLLKPRNNILNTAICLPRALDKLVEKNQKYGELEDSLDDGGLLAYLPDPFIAVNEIVSENGKKLVECILLNDTHWIFVSHVEAYLRDGSGLDSCAHDKLETYYEQAEGSILTSGQGYSKTTWAQIII
ncbi:hypothetical protein BDC45DRAFT_532940 [Circinella umbellata]|nr:hypothetical protein BDC45DRAFT_532940 [Circinella umbellata]